MKKNPHELNIGTEPTLRILKDFSGFLQLRDEGFVKHTREAKAIRMVEAIMKKATTPTYQREAYFN